LVRLQGLPGVHVHANHAVLLRGAFLPRASEAVKLFANGDLLEPRRLQDFDKLCTRQSTGNSTCPEINIPPEGFIELGAAGV
jgi:hypothetical protein